MDRNNTEQQIIKVAKQVFIENGYADTRMGHIAERVGINRSGLHYYFRTKERMFDAVFADIVHSFIPEVQGIMSKNTPIKTRIEEVVNIYFNVMKNEPQLPIFVIKEIQRDAKFLIDSIQKFEAGEYVCKIKDTLLYEMERGNIKKIPIEFIFYTFCGLLYSPFLSKPLADLLFEQELEFNDKINHWEQYVTEQLIHLVCP